MSLAQDRPSPRTGANCPTVRSPDTVPGATVGVRGLASNFAETRTLPRQTMNVPAHSAEFAERGSTSTNPERQNEHTTHARLLGLADRDHGFRWRGREVSRLEGLSDAVFAFSVTLLVVSLEVPHTFNELLATMTAYRVLAFLTSFLVLFGVWHAQYIFFRRYGLEDGHTTQLNALLLCVVLFYIYPLKFLFTTWYAMMTGHGTVTLAGGRVEPLIERSQWGTLMIIYSVGFILIYLVFALLYHHAWKKREELQLSAEEIVETRFSVIEQLLMVGVGTVALLMATRLSGGISGLAYMLIPVVQTVQGFARGKARRRLAQA